MVPYPPPAIVSGKKLRSVVEYQVVDGLNQTKSRSPFMTSIIKKHLQTHSSCTQGIRVLALNKYSEEFFSNRWATFHWHHFQSGTFIYLFTLWLNSVNEVTNGDKFLGVVVVEGPFLDKITSSQFHFGCFNCWGRADIDSKFIEENTTNTRHATPLNLKLEILKAIFDLRLWW